MVGKSILSPEMEAKMRAFVDALWTPSEHLLPWHTPRGQKPTPRKVTPPAPRLCHSCDVYHGTPVENCLGDEVPCHCPCHRQRK